MWQRFGRGGRRAGKSLAILVTSSRPLDQYFATHTEELLGTPVEHARIDPDNLDILVQHIKCAAFEMPFRGDEAFGDMPPESTEEVLQFLADNEVLHATSDVQTDARTYHWATDTYPASHVSLRSIGWDNVGIIDLERDEILAELDWHSAHTMLHEQAIYQHSGSPYQVERFDYENHKAFVRAVEPDYYTTAMTHVRVDVIERQQNDEMGFWGAYNLDGGFGDVSVVEKVVGYKKIKYHTHENAGYGEVRLPEIQMHTTSAWFAFPAVLVDGLDYPRAVVLEALRGLGKALQTVSVAGLMCEYQDLTHVLGEVRADGGGSKRKSSDIKFDPAIFLYDSMPGGIGLSERVYLERMELFWRARRLIEACLCQWGCPSCIGPQVGVEGDEPEQLHPRKHISLAILESLGIR
jgi:DEAD/DEAH box helicase domain-containing protein